MLYKPIIIITSSIGITIFTILDKYNSVRNLPDYFIFIISISKSAGGCRKLADEKVTAG